MKAELVYINDVLSVRFLKVKRASQFNAAEKQELEMFIKQRHLEIVEKRESFFISGKKTYFWENQSKIKIVSADRK